MADVKQTSKPATQCWKCGDLDPAGHAKCDVPACGIREPAEQPVAQMQEIARLHDRIKELERDVEFLSLPAPQPAIPPGYKLVPVEPTHNMILAGACDPQTTPRTAKYSYRAMLNAAPEVPQPAKREPQDGRFGHGGLFIPNEIAWGIVGSSGHARKRHVDSLHALLKAAHGITKE